VAGRFSGAHCRMVQRVRWRTNFVRNAVLVQRNVHSTTGLLSPPAYPKSGYEVVRALKRALDQAECAPGQALEQQQFGNLLGIPKITIHDWFHGRLANPIRSFLCAFERLTEKDRILLLRDFCRRCPRLEHPRLAHSSDTLNRLRAILKSRTGLTVVVGPSEPRSFLVTALGHSVTRLDPKTRVCGLDVHRPDTFVPVAGVCYCQNPPNSAQAVNLVTHSIKEAEVGGADLVIFNGVWPAISQHPHKIRGLERV